uniref:Uncharacterized protein n=1 Tax=Anguilla anguilla TaxID=7936 RepID=A0A0E9RQV7_ANGAN
MICHVNSPRQEKKVSVFHLENKVLNS